MRRSAESISASCLRTRFAASSERAAPLAQLVHEKTGGNPFFAIQFMFALAEEGMLAFDHDAARWSWDLDRIHAKRYTDNVVDLMLGEVHPAARRNARLPCSRWPVSETWPRPRCFRSCSGISEEQVHADLWPAVRQELVEPQAGAYRVRPRPLPGGGLRADPGGERPAAHLRIGRLIAARTPPEAIEENVFEIVSQLNRGAALITTPAEREKLAELNLLAGQRAKSATAFAMALAHFTAGETMLPEDRWERHYALSFALALHRAECEFLTGEQAAAKTRLAELATPCGHPPRSRRRHPAANGAKLIATSRLPSTTCGASGSRGRRNPRQRRSDRNTSGCGGRSVTARSRHCSTCPG